MELFPYQEEGVRWLAERRRGLLADTMGLGKTAQAVRAVRDVGAQNILVVSPASVVENWRREFSRWWPEWSATATLTTVSYDKLVRGIALPAVDAVILDEAHYLKNPKAKRTKAVLGPKMDGVGGVIERAAYVWALTGTPAPNNPSELWPLLHALAPGLILGQGKEAYKPMNWFRFVNRYCVVRNNGFGDQIVRGRNLDELRQRIAPFVLRRRKEEVLKDLPELRFGELPLSGPKALMALDRLEHDDQQKIVRALKEGPEALSKLSTEMSTVRRLTALAKVPLVAEWVKEWLEGCDEKIVVFAQHREALAALEAALAEYSPAVVHGEVPANRRQDAVDAFQHVRDRRVFLGQIQAAGTGITLTAASDLIFLEQSWVPAENAQAAMRIHRIGQRRGCLVRTAHLAGSIDEAVQQVLARKTEDLVKLFDAVA